MAETDVGSNESFANIGIKFGFTPDPKSEKNMKKSFAGLTSLVSDLAIISKIAGDALGKIWDMGAKQLKIGIEEGKLGVAGDVRGSDPNETRRLRDALESAGGSGEDALKLIQELDKYTRAFQNPATEFGKEYITRLHEMLSRYGVSEEQKAKLVTDFEGGDQQKALETLTEIIDGAGNEASNLMEALKLSSLSILENEKSMELFRDKMSKAGEIYGGDEDALLGAGSSMSQINESLNYLARAFTTMVEGPLSDFAQWFENFVLMGHEDWWSEIKRVIYENLIPKNTMIGQIRDWDINRSEGDENMNKVMKSLPSVLNPAGRLEWLREFNEYTGSNYRNIASLVADRNLSKTTQEGTFDTEQMQEKLEVHLSNDNLYSGYFGPSSMGNLVEIAETERPY